MGGFPAVAPVDSGRLYSAGGEATSDRRFQVGSGGINVGSQQLNFTGFVALRTEVINNITIYVGSQAAAATPTICRMGVYQFDNSANAVLVAETANDTTLFSVANTKYQRALTTPFNKVAGVNYGLTAFVVSATTMPNFLLPNNIGGSVIANSELRPPVMNAFSTGPFADLPATVSVGSYGNGGACWFMEVLP